MAAAVSISRAFGPLTSPVRIAAADTWIAPATWDRANAERRIRDMVAPHLTHRADGDSFRAVPRLVYVPFWRVKLVVAGVHLGTSSKNLDIGNITFPMPSFSIGGRAGVLMISARTVVPYTPCLPVFFGGGTDALEVQRSELVPMVNDGFRSILVTGELVDADVDRVRGERTAVGTLVELLRKPDVVHSIFQPRVESTTFVLYPFWYARFGDDDYFVLLSARDGKTVSARLPRSPSISERVKRFLSG